MFVTTTNAAQITTKEKGFDYYTFYWHYLLVVCESGKVTIWDVEDEL